MPHSDEWQALMACFAVLGGALAVVLLGLQVYLTAAKVRLFRFNNAATLRAARQRRVRDRRA